MTIREGDIFRFSYSTEYRKKLFEPHHCFDGQLVAVKAGDGLILMDSYWLHQFQPRDDSRWFTEEDARSKGELTLVCNINDVEKVEQWRTDYYDDADVFDLSYQHRCYPYFAVRKGAPRSKDKMVQVVREKIQKERRAIESALSSIERLARTEQMINDGRIEDAYI